MRIPRLRLGAALAALSVSLVPTSLLADEGQWMPAQIHDLDKKTLRAYGLQLEPGALWTPGDEKSLLRAVVNLSGCSAALISEEGLISTNHHCAYRAIQAASSVEHDYLKDGYLSPSREKELQAKGLTVKVLQSIEDVTEAIHQARDAAAGQAEHARALAVEKKRKELVQACEEQAHRTCQVESFYRGSLYQLHTYLELTDVRLVYAPPSAVGRYGGEIDNWMWPRHSGDFSLLRAYVSPDGSPASYAEENVPYRPERWLEVSPDGVPPGGFVATIGYPGHTDRYLSAKEVERQVEQVFPALIDAYGEWIDIQKELAEGNDELRLKVAGRLRSLENRHKNARGMLDGIDRMDLVERRRAEDADLAALAAKKGEPWAGVPSALAELSDERRARFEERFLLKVMPRLADAPAVAFHLVRWAQERKKPDLERAEGYQDRDQERLWRRVERHLGSFAPVVDEALLKSWLERYAQAVPDGPALAADLDASKIIKGTTLFEPGRARALFEAGDIDALSADPDPALALGRALAARYVSEVEMREKAEAGVELVVGPRYFELLKEVREGPVYPDANGTLRFSYATVKGYSPRDGLFATPRTTVAGQVRKHTGEFPFDLPARVRGKAPDAAETYWADPVAGDVPVCFLSTSDTTGGNSGSPVVDGRGRLVGFNFDRVWENIAGDFGYNPERSRNIAVDVRYLLWLLDEVEDAGFLLQELGLAAYRDKPARPARGGQALATPGAGPARPKASWADSKKSCQQGPGAPSAVLGLALVGLAARRRRRRPQL